ncbi:MAG: hypothetical protein ABJL44_13295 [Algibacter sp.]
MKKYVLTTLVLFGISCKKEHRKPEETKKNETEIKMNEENLFIYLLFELNNEMDRKSFNDICIPMIEGLYKQNPNRYKMVQIIGAKLSKESNIEAFRFGLENIVKELNRLRINK